MIRSYGLRIVHREDLSRVRLVVEFMDEELAKLFRDVIADEIKRVHNLYVRDVKVRGAKVCIDAIGSGQETVVDIITILEAVAELLRTMLEVGREIRDGS